MTVKTKSHSTHSFPLIRGVEKHRLVWKGQTEILVICLSTKAVESAALALERMDHIKSSHSLATSVLSVGHSVTNDVFEEHLEDTTGFFINKSRNALHTSSSRKTTNCWLRDALDVVARIEDCMKFLHYSCPGLKCGAMSMCEQFCFYCGISHKQA